MPHKKTHHTRSLKDFTAHDDLWCVVTVRSWSAGRIEFALRHLIDKGYYAEIRKIGGYYCVIRLFKPEELTDWQFMQTYGEYITKNGDDYVISTTNK